VQQYESRESQTVAHRRTCFEFEPSSAKDGVAEWERDAAEQRKRTDDIENTSCEPLVLDGHPLNQAAQNGSLHERSDQRANCECDVPCIAMPIRLHTELEGDAPESQREQHENDWKIEGRQQNRIRCRKCRQHVTPAMMIQVSLPSHVGVMESTMWFARRECWLEEQQYTHSQIEPVQDDLESQREGHETCRE